MKRQFLRARFVVAMFPRTRPYTNRAAARTDDYNGRSSRASSWRERALSRTGWISKHSQKDVDSSGKALSTDWACSYWLMADECYLLIVNHVTCNYTVLWVYSQAIKINIGAQLFLFLVINSFKGRPFSGPKK